jgi:two-component system sensor histidine kinase UhpB
MRKPSLVTQILAVNALLITATVLAAIVAAKVSVVGGETQQQTLLLAAGILATVLVNGFVVRRRLAPLERLIATMERVDLAEPGTRAEAVAADSAEVVRLQDAFNVMLARLEEERARAADAVLRAQEEERARLARDLHDECNQALTGVLLRLKATAQTAPPEIAAELRETASVATAAMDELLRLARELRPAALDDHGLQAALHTQLERFSAQHDVPAELSVYDELSDLQLAEQTVVYRVVQESLSNIARHAGASQVRVELGRDHGRPVVRVVDDGCGFSGSPGDGLGLLGMRERARLAGGRLEVQSGPGRGTTIELRLDRDLWRAAA